MGSRRVRALGTCLLCVTWTFGYDVALRVPTACASGEPQESFLYRNFAQASDVLDRAIAAHGGAALLDRSADFRITYTGTLRYEGHYPRPWASKDYAMEGTTLYSVGLKALKSEQTFVASDKPMPAFTLVGPANGIALEAGNDKPDSIPGDDLWKAMQKELEFLPQEYLRQARDGAAGLRLLSGADGAEVVVFALEDGESRGLYFDPTTHLLMRVERIGHWKHKGDRLEWRTFSDYFDQNGIQLPRHSEAHIEESSTQYNVISEITTLELGQAVNPNAFTIPADFRTGFESWTLTAPAAENAEALLPFHDLGKGVYIIDLPPSDARSLLVAFADFAVIVEAGDYSEISARLLATADHLLPDKPVRYVAMSHHHPLYANGLRPYAQRGITILATPGAVSYYRDLTTRPYRIHPDAQQREPREPKIEIIDGKRILQDKKQRLEFHEFDYSTHTDEFVLTYLPSHKLIVTGDTVYILRDQELRPANSRERAIHRVVEEHKLKVEHIMQTWFLRRSEGQVPYSVLEEKVRLAVAKEQKP